MKNLKQVFITTSLATVLLFGSATSVFAAEGNFITTNGTGVVKVQPDTAQVSLSIQTMGKTASSAQKENNKISANVVEKLEQMGVPKDKIITGYSYVYPSYTYDDITQKRNISSYTANTSIDVTLKDIDNVGAYVDAALSAGATGFNSAIFSIEDPSKYYGEALKAAVKNASSSASAIAAAYGTPLGQIQSVVEHASYSSFEESSYREKALADTAYGNTAGGTVINYDKIQISASITATYEI
ncbi:SIMPL domain-containing protein [Anaerotignum sp.]|uniref:SIMPL domain-containing protein n=1 Tax=Anaerotignum sp. TaxID=2039241 RepID=UPI003323271F